MMATDAGRLELSAKEVLEDLRRRCLAYVVVHHDPGKAKGEDTWTAAIKHVLGSDEWWEKHSADPRSVAWTKEDVERYMRVVIAWTAIAKIGMIAARDFVHRERLLGKAAERPEGFSPEWTGLYVGGTDDDNTRPGRLDIDVANYLTNVRGGQMEAMVYFYALEDDK